MARGHGITKAEYSTDSGTNWTQINNLVPDGQVGCSLTPQGLEEPVEDPQGNSYSAPEYWNIQLEALDDSAYSTLDSEHSSDNKVRFRFTLEDGGTFTCDVDILAPVHKREIQGAVQGRSEGFVMGDAQDVRIRDDDVTIT